MESEDFVPIIDIGPLFGNDAAAKLNVAHQIDRVCRGRKTNVSIHAQKKIAHLFDASWFVDRK